MTTGEEVHEGQAFSEKALQKCRLSSVMALCALFVNPLQAASGLVETAPQAKVLWADL